MRVFHICNLRNNCNGIYTVLEALSTEQQKLGNSISVLNINKIKFDSDLFIQCDINATITKIKDEHPDVVIFHGIYYFELLPISSFLRKHNIPYFVELHGAMSIENMRKSKIKKTISNYLFLNKVIRKACGIIYLNEQELNNSTVRDLNHTHLIIPNGCYPTGHRLAYRDNTVNITFIGRIDIHHKGLDILIDAITEIQDFLQEKKVHFSFYGNGGDKQIQWLKNEISRLGNIADYYGPVYGDDKKSAFTNTDIFIHTSRYEGFPMAILEALSYGIPCIVTPGVNVTDIIEKNDCGWVTDLDLHSISQAIIKAVNDNDIHRNQIIDNAVNASEQYLWSSIAKYSITKYSEFISEKHNFQH